MSGHRHAWLIGAFIALTLLAAPPRADAGDAVIEENLHAGSDAWQGPIASGRAIEGYASASSVLPGDPLGLHVSTAPAARYRIEIYRLGWYGGAGARRMTCQPACHADEQGASRAVPAPDPETGWLNAGWPVTDTISVGSDWLSGEYLARLVLTDGDQAGSARLVPFVVLPPVTRSAAMLVQLPINTWQAYNDWGGKSLYDGLSSNNQRAVKVSFDRPFATDSDNTLLPSPFEFPAIRFLERNGYDVAYQTDLDTSRDPSALLRYRAVVSLGHDEYWTREMRDAFEAARSAGVNLAFLGGNSAYTQARYEDDGRTLVVYRSDAADPDTDPAEKTVNFRALRPPRPECEMMGAQFAIGSPRDGRFSWSLTADGLTDPWSAGTGFVAGDLVPDAVIKEWDDVVPGCAPAPPTVLFRWADDAGSESTATRYVAASGARVFDAASLGFVRALGGEVTDPCGGDPRLQAFARNMFDSLASAGGSPLPAVACRTGGSLPPPPETVLPTRGPGGEPLSVPRARFGSHTAVAVIVRRRARVRHGVLRVAFRNGNEFLVRAAVLLRRDGGRRVAHRIVTLGAAARTTTRLHAGRVRRRPGIRARLVVALTDPAGDRRTIRRRVRLWADSRP